MKWVSTLGLINYRNGKREMLFCRCQASAEMKDESGFSATELYHYLSTTLCYLILVFFYNRTVTNCKLLQTELALQLNATKSWQTTKPREQKKGGGMMDLWIKDRLNWTAIILLRHDWSWRAIKSHLGTPVITTVRSQQLVPFALQLGAGQMSST